MKIENLEEKTNKTLERKEVSAKVVFEGSTPSRADIKKEICVKVGANPDLSVLRKVETHYGSTSLNAELHVYENAEKMKEVENEYLLKRDKLVGEKKEEGAEKKEEKPAEAPKEEPKEEKKEEKKEEPKPEEKKE